MTTTLAVIGDVHAHYGYLQRVLDHIRARAVDGILLVGDLGSSALSLQRMRTADRDAAYLLSVARVLEMTRALGPPVLYVPGNHDLPDLSFPGNIDGHVVTIGELRIGGIGGAGPGRFGFCYEWDEDEIRARPALECDVILCHCPPRDTPLDRVPHRGIHVGSAAIRERAEKHIGALVCGHIHESPGIHQVNACLCLNAGGLGRPFGLPQVGYLTATHSRYTAEHYTLS